MKFGIPEKSINMIIRVLLCLPEIEKASVFGSRAIGNYKNGSDFDLVIYGPKVTEKTVSSLSVQLNEELPLPYFFDIVHYESLTNEDLKSHIDTCAKSFYSI